MIEQFVTRWEANKAAIRAEFEAKHPHGYIDVVRAVIRHINSDGLYSDPSPDRIHQIDDGDYQGTLVFVIAAAGYQPSDYWYVRMSYGSCSVCDALQSIKDYSDEDDPPSEEQVDRYMTMALHIVQRLKKMDADF
ncbi:MAG: hypothetical protein KGQ57_10655 [Burkholderiales bacterium]|nr:hypothetical protein [Burkholderiales bacterium]